MLKRRRVVLITMDLFSVWGFSNSLFEYVFIPCLTTNLHVSLKESNYCMYTELLNREQVAIGAASHPIRERPLVEL